MHGATMKIMYTGPRSRFPAKYQPCMSCERREQPGDIEERNGRGTTLFGVGFTSFLPQHEAFKTNKKHKKCKKI